MAKNHSIFIFSFCLGLFSQATFPVFAENGTVLFSDSPKEEKERCRMQSKRWTYWSVAYQEEIRAAKESKKPLILAFMGSSWCPWSQKLEEDVLTQNKFAQALKEEFHLIWLDFPESGEENLVTEEMRKLKEQYQVEEFPSIVLVDADEVISKVSYLPLGAEEFASHLKKIYTSYREIKELIREKGLESLSSNELKELYQKAAILNNSPYQEKILQAGVKVDKGTFFLLEKYAAFLKTGKKRDEQAISLRQQIVERDPKNHDGSQFALAVLDFEMRAKRLKRSGDPKSALRPLFEYVQRFGEKDKENGWRAEMMIAQYLFAKKEVQEALKHAKASYQSAPESAKTEIAQSIDFLKTHGR